MSRNQRRKALLKRRQQNWQLREAHEDKMEELGTLGVYAWRWLESRGKWKRWN